MNKLYILLASCFLFVPLIGCAKHGQHYIPLSEEERKYYKVLNDSDSVGMVNCITSAIQEYYKVAKDRKIDVIFRQIVRDRVSPETQAKIFAIFTINGIGQTKTDSLYFKMFKESGEWKQREMGKYEIRE